MLQQTSHVFAEARRVLAAALSSAPQANRGFLAGTPVETPEGRRPVEALMQGDLVSGQDGKPRCLMRVERVVLQGRAAQSCLKQAALLPEGLLGNAAPLVVLAGQTLLVHVPRARGMLGSDFALLPAKALAGLKGVLAPAPAAQVETVRLVFAADEAVWVGPGLLVQCPADEDHGSPAPQVPVLDTRGAEYLIDHLARPTAPSPFRAPKASLPRRVKPTGRGKRDQAAAGRAP